MAHAGAPLPPLLRASKHSNGGILAVLRRQGNTGQEAAEGLS